jgi:hypothetical protein
MWLLDALDIPLNGAKVDINVLTGSDALGRGVEMENFNAAVSYMAALNNLPPAMVERIKVGSIAEFIGQGTQTEMSRFFLTDEEAQAQQAQAQQQDVNQQAAVSAVQQQ